MENNRIGTVLEQARLARRITRPQLAAEMAGEDKSKSKSIEGQLWRYEKEGRKPSEQKLHEMAGALSSLAKDPDLERDQLLSDLLEAAGVETTDYQRSYLRRQCEVALKQTGLKEHEIQKLLGNMSDATLMRIAEAAKNGEEIAVMDLRGFPTQFQDTVDQKGRTSGSNREAADHVIQAGRAKIVVNGELSTTQKQLLEDMARMIRTALDT